MTKHRNKPICHCGNVTLQTLQLFVKYPGFTHFFSSHSLSVLLFFVFLFSFQCTGTGLEVPIHIYFLPPERPMDHINSRKPHDILQLYWYTGGPYSPQLQYFFLWLYLSIWSTRKICTLYCWRAEMKCCTHFRNNQHARICTRRLSYSHVFILCRP